MLTALLTSLSLLVAGDRKEPDLVVLADGKEIECRVLFEDDEEVVYRAKGKERHTPLAEIKTVQSLERSSKEFLERHEKVSRNDVAALSELALFAEQSF